VKTLENTTEAPVTQESAPKEKGMIAGKFGGHFGPVGLGLYNVLLACGIDRKLATKFGMDYMSDWARSYDSSAAAKSKVGKFNDNREAKMTAAGMKAAKQAGTSSMFIARYAQTMDALFEEGVITKRTIDLARLPDFVNDYIAESKAWVEAQTWKE
jgi:hypothetical protein